MQQLCLRLDDDMKTWLEEQAKKEGFSSLAGYIRVHLNKLKTSGKWEIIEEIENE